MHKAHSPKEFLKEKNISLTSSGKYSQTKKVKLFETVPELKTQPLRLKITAQGSLPAGLSPEDLSNWVNEQFSAKIEINELEQFIQNLCQKHNLNAVEFVKQIPQKGARTLSRVKKDLELHALNMVEKKSLELNLKNIEKELYIADYPSLFKRARSIKRHFICTVGPTNSGKTYSAMQALKAANTGIYLAPLRLLALEGKDWLVANEVPCSLITGEEKVLDPFASHVSSTVEMCNFTDLLDVAVIDEAQLIADDYRGWAWTAAICGVAAEKVYLVGSEDFLARVIPLIESLGDTYEIVRFERKNKLAVDSKPFSLKDLRKGDALIAFSRNDALFWREELRSKGFSVAVIYGSLSPEVRKAEAARFNKGLADVLVATDAIGMGLNLPINRVILTTIEKYDGEKTRRLYPWEAAQIVGRAGRFGKSEKGVFAAMKPMEHALLDKLIKNPLRPFNPEDRLQVAPSPEQISKLSEILKSDSLGFLLDFFQKKFLKEDAMFKPQISEDSIGLAWRTDRFKKLSLETRFIYSCSPMDLRSEIHLEAFEQWLYWHENKSPCYLDLDERWSTLNVSEYWLLDAEQANRLSSLYLWMSLRFPEIYVDTAKALKIREQTSAYVEKVLSKEISKKKLKKGASF